MLQEYENYIKLLEMDHSPHTLTSYKISIGKFLNYYQIDTIDKLKSITPTQCRDYMGELKKAGLVNNSLNCRVRPLKSFFNFLQTEEKIDLSPWKNIRELKVVKRNPAFLSYDEIELLIQACKNINEKTILALFLTAGLRRNELITLKLNDVKDGHIEVMGKGSKYRKLALQDSVWELLTEYIRIRLLKWGNKFDNVFLSTHGAPYSGNGIFKKINSLCIRAKLPQDRINAIHTHSLRHTFATNLVSSNCDLRIVQSALGHSNINTTMIYAHVRNSAMDEQMLKQKSIL